MWRGGLRGEGPHDLRPPFAAPLDRSVRDALVDRQRSHEGARIRARLRQLSARLGDADWLDGAFSAGDLMMVSVLLRLRASGLLDEFPALAAYVARGEARPAYKRAFAAQLAVNAG